jgi:hypothetical protein
LGSLGGADTMQDRFMVAITVILFAVPMRGLAAGQADECMDIQGRISKQIDAATAGDLRQLFVAFASEACTNNAEFSECANELLFDIIEKRPLFFFQTLFAMPSDAVERIRAEIDNPIHDCINVARRYQAVSSAEMPKELKAKALSFLHDSYLSEKQAIKEWETKNEQKWSCP